MKLLETIIKNNPKLSSRGITLDYGWFFLFLQI